MINKNYQHPEYETMTTLQKKIDFLQNEVASKNAIIKILVEMQTGIWDWGNSCTSQDKDNITSVNITDNSFISVNNLKHKQNYDQKKKNREQNKEKTNWKNADQELSDTNQNGNQTTYTNRNTQKRNNIVYWKLKQQYKWGGSMQTLWFKIDAIS